MGYTKIVQFGNITEVYNYEKDISTKRRKHISQIAKKRRADIQKLQTNKRTKYSISRAKKNFFRLCHANNIKAKSIHFLTLTIATDTNYGVATSYVRYFFERLKKLNYEVENSELSYIGVPELTKKGRYHFHLLIYNLSSKGAGLPIQVRRFNRKTGKYYNESTTTERFTRNLQRQCWQRGYLEIAFAPTVTQGLAGYMAKYMGKHLANPTNQARRAYNCSRNIEKIRSYGSKTLDSYSDLLIPDKLADRVATYTVPFLGTCKYEKYHVL